jgi:hypothetical protein
MKNDDIAKLMRGEMDPAEIDTTKFMLNGTTVAALRNIRMKSQFELMTLQVSPGITPQEFQNIYTQKQYEVQFIDYLIELSDANIKQSNHKEGQ